MKTIVSISGGLGSAYALHKAIERDGRENVLAVFADVKGTGYSHHWSDLPSVEYLLHERFGGESPDTYSFIWQIAHALDVPIERLEDGRSIWAVFAQSRSFRLFIQGRFFCKASEELKRQTIAKWIERRFEPGSIRLALGMGFWEGHRIANAQGWWRRRLGWDIEVYSPFADEPIDQCVMSDWLNSIGVEAPAAYRDGYQHNNCRQMCVQAGQNQFAQKFQIDELGYWYDAWQEARLRSIVGIDATILKDERGGGAKPMTLEQFAERVKAGDWNRRDLGGSCSCFTTPAMTTFLSQVPLKSES